MRYKITFITGHSIELEGDSIDDNGIKTVVHNEGRKTIYHGPSIANIEQIDMPEIVSGDVNDYGGYCLYDDNGEMVMSIRKESI